MSSRAWSNVPIGFATGVLLLVADHAMGETQGTLQVQARIGETCSIGAATLDFGQGLDPEIGKDAEGSIEINCQSQTNLSIELSGGNPRFMTDSAENFITYQIYKDPGRSNLWVQGAPLNETITGSGSVPVYGRVPVQDNGQPPGLYTDEVIVTLNFE